MRSKEWLRAKILTNREINEATGCWDYVGRWEGDYPVIEIDGKRHRATAVTLWVFKGIEARYTCHKYKTCPPCCVNPDHLLGFATRAEMRRELVKWQGSPNRQIPDETREEIRRKKAQGWTHKRLMEAFGVSMGAVHYIVNGRKQKRRAAG